MALINRERRRQKMEAGARDFLAPDEHVVRGSRWLNSPLIAQERAALLRSYAGLLAAVHR